MPMHVEEKTQRHVLMVPLFLGCIYTMELELHLPLRTNLKYKYCTKYWTYPGVSSGLSWGGQHYGTNPPGIESNILNIILHNDIIWLFFCEALSYNCLILKFRFQHFIILLLICIHFPPKTSFLLKNTLSTLKPTFPLFFWDCLFIYIFTIWLLRRFEITFDTKCAIDLNIHIWAK